MSEILDQIKVSPHLEATLAGQLKEQLAWLIASHQLKPGDRLPSIRKLANYLAINLHTVRAAYQKLEADGIVETRQGWGTRVLPYQTAQWMRTANTTRTHTIGVIVPTFWSPFYHSFLDGAESVAIQKSSMLFVCSTHESHSDVGRYLAQFLVKQVDGILAVSLDISAYLPKGTASAGAPPEMLPCVAVDWPDYPGYSVLMDLENAGYEATRHLLIHGHHRIGLITYSMELPNIGPLHTGYRRALTEAGLAPDPTLIARVHGFDPLAGAEGARQLLAVKPRPEAVFAVADTLSMGAMQVFQSAGMRIPEDLAFTSFNDIYAAAMLHPPLTTVGAPARELGRTAMQILTELIAGHLPTDREIILPTSLVVRQSCGCNTKTAGRAV